MRNKANNFEGLYVNSNGEQINGSVLVSGNSDGFFAVIDKAVLNDITLKNTKSDGVIVLLDKGVLNSVKGSITLDMYDDFGAVAALWANKDINITSRNGSITALKLSSLESDGKADTENIETLKATENIKLKAGTTIDIEGQVTAGKNLVVNSDGINIVGNVSAGKNINLTIDKGNIGIAGSATSNEGNVAMTIEKGNLAIEGKVRALKGAIDIELDEGNIQIGKDTPQAETVVAKKDINIVTANGVIDISGKTKSTSGSVNIKGNKKAENTSANVPEISSYEVKPISFAAHSDETPSVEVNLFSANAAETNSAEVAPLAADAKKPDDIIIDGEIEANDSILIITDEGDIEVTKKLTVSDGDITIISLDGDIIIEDNGLDDMVRAQNDLDIKTDNGSVIISGEIATQDGNINITSNHDTYTAGQKGLTVNETGAINPGRNLNLNVKNGDIEFKRISAQNTNINSNTGNVTADTIKAADTLRIALERGDLYLNLAQSKGVAIIDNDDSSKSTVNTIQANSVDVNDAVTVGKVLPYRSSSVIAQVGGGKGGNYSSGYSNSYGNGYSNFASNGNSFATLGTTFTNNGLTYWQSADSTAAPSYSFSEFESFNDMSYRQTRNYFEVKFIPTWLEKEFLSIDFDYSFDDFGIKNATEDELTIE